MELFKHVNGNTLNGAIQILEENREKSKIFAGGTDLLGTLKDRIHNVYPEVLVNIKTINELDYIREDEEGLKIGATTKLHAIGSSRVIKEKYSVLAEAARSVASPQIRRMGTLAGNICQEPRCWYYRNPDNTFYCTRKGGKYCNALTGENRYHSIFGAMRVDRSPCTANCPGSVDIPSYMDKIREDDFLGAAKILLESNPIPAITGRVCPHFCEQGCNRAQYDESVSIRGVERFLGDYILDNTDNLKKSPAADTGKRVTIVGSGPAGLSAAYYLKRGGNRVTVLDRMEEAGGMLTYGIPEYRLPKAVVRRVVDMFKGIGIEFRLEVAVGEDVTLEELRSESDAVFLAGGAWKQPSIGLAGEELTISGLKFLSLEKPLEISGKKVLVIGGGNVAIDAGVTALRMGAETVTLACLESREEMPALQWEIEQAIEEGIQLMPSRGPAKILQADGKVTGIELARCTSVFDEKGRFSPSLDENEKEIVDADLVVLAVGQKPDLSFIEPASSLGNERGLIQVDKDTQQTNVAGLFAGGDAASGPATVIEAVGSGKRAAASIHRYLNGKDSKIGDDDGGVNRKLLKFNSRSLKRSRRAEGPQLPVALRKIDVEDSPGLGSGDIASEANRCFNCGCVAVSASDIAPALVALDAKIKTTKRTIEAEAFFHVRAQKTTALDENEIVTEIQLPAPMQGSESVYEKFRIRKAIDFPIMSVASVLSMKSDEVTDARIVLGAAAPVPLRLKDVEDTLKGRKLDEKSAENAAQTAVKGAMPLEKNEFKVFLTRALVKRAILANKKRIME